MYYADRYRDMYQRILGPLSRDVVLKVNNGAGYDDYTVPAHVSKWQERDLVPGGSIQLGDLRLIILTESLPDGVTTLTMKDRVEIDGRAYGVIHWDEHTRAIGDNQLAVDVTVRG